MGNPCKNCAVKGNCTTICKPYNKFQIKMATVITYITMAIIGSMIVLLFTFHPIVAFIIWGGSTVFCHIIPVVSNETGIFDSLIIGPFIISIFILATISRPYVMRPTDYKKYKKLTRIERFFGIDYN